MLEFIRYNSDMGWPRTAKVLTGVQTLPNRLGFLTEI
jgi:hypothetical protein